MAGEVLEQVWGKQCIGKGGFAEASGRVKVRLTDKVVIVLSKAINVPHHTGGPVESLKEVTEEFLLPASNLMLDRTVVFENFFDSGAVAEPKEFGSPKKLRF